MATLPASSQRELQLFKRQYLQYQANPDFPTSDSLRQERFQCALYDELFSEDAEVEHPPQRYQLRILKELMRRIESSITDWDEEGISDDLTDCLTTLLTSSIPSELTVAQQKAFVTYSLSSLQDATLDKKRGSESVPTITLLESRYLLAAAGTTGLRTWEASLHLGVFLCSPGCPVNIRGKSILELGAGTGYLSILCAKFLGAAHVTSSDGSDTVVNDLPTSFFLNGLQDDPKITISELVWGHPLAGGEEPSWKSGRAIDVVIGADVTFDSSAIPALVTTLQDVAACYPAVEILIAAAIRNEATFCKFQNTCERLGFAIVELEFPVPPSSAQKGPFYSDAIPMKICKLKRRQV